MDGFAGAVGSQTLSGAVEGSVAIVSNVVGLLETFVGRELCSRLLSDVWPNATQIDNISLKENSDG